MNDKERLIVLIATLRTMATYDEAATTHQKDLKAWAKYMLALIEVPIEAGK